MNWVRTRASLKSAMMNKNTDAGNPAPVCLYQRLDRFHLSFQSASLQHMYIYIYIYIYHPPPRNVETLGRGGQPRLSPSPDVIILIIVIIVMIVMTTVIVAIVINNTRGP